MPRVDVPAAARRPWRLAQLGPNVFFIGLTSLVTDVSSEMVNAVLPLYLAYTLRFSPLAFGFFDGIYQGVSALVRLWGGVIADRGRRPKQVAAAGYAVSAVCKIGLVISGAWPLTTLFLFVDRLGKGIRTAPRDALIALSSPRERWGEAFGVHRAMDMTGALIGPLVAFMLLARMPDAYDAVFAVSAAVGFIGLGVLLCFVENRRGEAVSGVAGEKSLETARTLLRIPRFRTLVLVGTVLSLATVSDAFVYLVVQRRAELDPSLFPLLPVAMTVAYVALSVPIGRCADRVGRGRVFLAGYAALGAAYALLAWGAGRTALFSSLPLLGVYYAATDGVLMAMASQTLPAERLTSGLAVLTTAVVVGRLVASALFGALWSWRGPEGAVAVFLAGLLAALIVGGLSLRETV